MSAPRDDAPGDAAASLVEAANSTPSDARHSAMEDVQGLVTGCLLVGLAVGLFRESGLLTGGTTGLAFLIHYLAAWPLGLVLFVINLPFYVFGWLRLGHVFTLKTFAAVGLLCLLIELLPRWVGFTHLNPVFAAVMAGLLAGTGMLILIRHGASLGGVSIVAVYLQKSRGWRAGTVQMVVDAFILLAAFGVTSVRQALLSLLGAVAVNLVIRVNHRSDRYFGV